MQNNFKNGAEIQAPVGRFKLPLKNPLQGLIVIAVILVVIEAFILRSEIEVQIKLYSLLGIFFIMLVIILLIGYRDFRKLLAIDSDVEKIKNVINKEILGQPLYRLVQLSDQSRISFVELCERAFFEKPLYITKNELAKNIESKYYGFEVDRDEDRLDVVLANMDQWIEELFDLGWVKKDKDKYYLTDKGLEIYERFKNLILTLFRSLDYGE